MKFHEPSNPWLERFAQSDPLSIEVSLDILKNYTQGRGNIPSKPLMKDYPFYNLSHISI